MTAGDVSGWCGRRDLNPHDLRHWNLNPARLPIPPRPPRLSECPTSISQIFLAASAFSSVAQAPPARPFSSIPSNKRAGESLLACAGELRRITFHERTGTRRRRNAISKIQEEQRWPL